MNTLEEMKLKFEILKLTLEYTKVSSRKIFIKRLNEHMNIVGLRDVDANIFKSNKMITE